MIILTFSRVGDTKDPAAVTEKLCSSESETTGHGANSKPYNSPQKTFNVSVIQNRTQELLFS